MKRLAYGELLPDLTPLLYSAEWLITRILEPLARLENVSCIAKMRLVCSAWRDFTRAISHLNLPKRIFHPDLIVSHLFPRTRALVASDLVLCSCSPGYSSVQQLFLSPMPYGQGLCSQPMDQWKALRQLIFPNCRRYLPGLDRLGNLEEVEITACALREPECIRFLSRVRRLTITGLPRRASHCLRELHFLEYLATEWLWHFECYTGDGRLLPDPAPTCIDTRDDLKEVFGPDCFAGTLVGSWQNGLFTGDAHLCFGTNCDNGYEFNGRLVDNIREGYGEEYRLNSYNRGTLFCIDWKAGHAHGLGNVFEAPEENSHPLGVLPPVRLLCQVEFHDGRLVNILMEDGDVMHFPSEMDSIWAWRYKYSSSLLDG